MSDLVKGIGNVITSIFQVIEGAITAVVNTIIIAFQTVADVIVGTFKSVFNLTEGAVGLVVGMFAPSVIGPPSVLTKLEGNFVLILSAIVIYFGYIQYQKRQGNNNPAPIANAAKTVNKKLQ